MKFHKLAPVAAAALALAVSVPAKAQLGALRRAVQHAATTTAGNNAAAAVPQQQQPASATVGHGNVLELTPAVLERFQQALNAEAAEREQTARQLAAIKTPEAYRQCSMQFLLTPTAQGWAQRITTAAEHNDQPRMIAVNDSLRGALLKSCGVDPADRGQIENRVRDRAEQVGVQAGQFTPAEYGVIKERVVPFCRSSATAANGDVRVPGQGSGISFVYTATEAAALHDRCAALMAGMNRGS